MDDRILVIDAGTTSTRAMLFDAHGTVHALAAEPVAQLYPRPGWVEHDADAIWRSVLAVGRRVAAQADTAIAAIGIANQRETVVFWDRATGAPLAPAIVWQDRRTADVCRGLRERGLEADVQATTGLLIDPYFSATKIGWAMRHWPQLAAAGDRLAIGTVEAWLVWKLTGGLHLTDATNASRTALMAIGSGGWDDGLIDLFGVPRAALPEIVDCAGRFATTDAFGPTLPICGLAGDQQAAAIGQACLAKGDTKATFGTGAFVLTHAGPVPPRSRHRLLSTVAWQLGGRRAYALEGSVFVAGSLIGWLRDSLGLLSDAADSAEMARQAGSSGGVFVVPALTGLGAPWWNANARATICGLGFASGRAQIVRAALEAMAHQAHDLKSAFAADGADWQGLRIDGGMAANDWMAQDLADMLDLTVERPANVETTALGAAMLAGVGAGLFADLDEASAMRGATRTFTPAIDPHERDRRLRGWARAVEGVLATASEG